MTGFPWSIVATVVGGLMSIIGALILVNLQSIKRCISKLSGRIEKQDALIADVKETNDAISVAMLNCKVDCHRDFVTGEAFLRETGFMRRTLENQTASINRIEGQLTLVDKLPAICGDISRNIVREMKDIKP
jgi:hypothetical protein